MTTTTRTADGDHLEISKAGFGTIRIESLDRNGTPNWGLTLTAADATEIADILGTFAADLTEGQRHTGAENAAAADDAGNVPGLGDPLNVDPMRTDPFAGLDTPTNDGWDA